MPRKSNPATIATSPKKRTYGFQAQTQPQAQPQYYPSPPPSPEPSTSHNISTSAHPDGYSSQCSVPQYTTPPYYTPGASYGIYPNDPAKGYLSPDDIRRYNDTNWGYLPAYQDLSDEENFHVWALRTAKLVCIAFQMDPKPPSVDSLPCELLEEMFTQYLRGSLEPRKGRKRKSVVTTWRPDWNRDWRPKDVSRIPNLVVLSHVCSLWRRLAHANPSLWSAVMVWGNISQRDVEMLRLWLSLSQSVPLQICLHQVRYASAAQDAWREVLASVSAHGARWQKVEMCIAGVDDTLNRHRWWSGLRTPNLEYFDFQKLQTPECQWSPDDIWELYRKICTSSDKLCHIGADQYFSRWGWIPGVPWHNLKEINLTAGGVSYVEFIELLGLCVSLEIARIFVFDLELLQDLSASSSTLQFLELVTAEGAILDSLTLPALRSLHMMIANRIDEEETIWPAIERFSTRHPDCRLEEFQYYRQLVIQSFEYFTTVIALPLFQDLVRLYLEVCMSDRTLEALTFTPISQPLPCLEIISLERCHATDGTLSAMLLSRTNGVAVSRLREAHVVFGSYFRPVHREQFPKDLSLQIPDVYLKIRVYSNQSESDSESE